MFRGYKRENCHTNNYGIGLLAMFCVFSTLFNATICDFGVLGLALACGIVWGSGSFVWTIGRYGLWVKTSGFWGGPKGTYPYASIGGLYVLERFGVFWGRGTIVGVLG